MTTTEQISQDISSDTQLSLWRTMLRIRRFEESVEKLFMAGEIPGFVHLCIGQEAVAAGVCANLELTDYITSTHRGHGHTLAKGAKMNRMLAELYGRATGYCKGKGGSMHIADFSVGMLGANGIVAGGFNIAIGAGMSIRILKNSRVAVCFFGDGASNRGPFHECLNWASVFKLPVVFVCEHNGYASTSAAGHFTSVTNIVERAPAYSMNSELVDGNDALAIYGATRRAVERARGGDGPTLLEAKTYRIKGHYVGDPTNYREREEVARWQQQDAITRLEEHLRSQQLLDDPMREQFAQEVEQELAEAIEFARSSPFPDPEDALEDVYATVSKE